jgi:Flp pilus assembly protein TadD
LHWLLGLVRLARGDENEARAEFDREIAAGTTQLYAAEFAMNAYDGAGYTALDTDDPAGAVQMFTHALELFPDHARSLVGLGFALDRSGDAAGAVAAFTHAARAIDSLRRGGRTGEATLSEAFMKSVQGQPDDAIALLKRLVDHPSIPFAGWTIPIEPFLAPLRQRPDFKEVLTTLGQNAR